MERQSGSRASAKGRSLKSSRLGFERLERRVLLDTVGVHGSLSGPGISISWLNGTR